MIVTKLLKPLNLVIIVLGVIFSEMMQVGQNKLIFKKVGMIFDLAENFTNYSWDLLPSFDDNVKSAGPP
jgi:hypothetical protein